MTTASLEDLPVTVNLTAYHGDTWSQTFRFLDGGQPYDFSGATVAASARDGSGNVQSLSTSTDTDGQIVITSSNLDVGVYSYDIEVDDGNVLTWVCGQLRVRPDVTNA